MKRFGMRRSPSRKHHITVTGRDHLVVVADVDGYDDWGAWCLMARTMNIDEDFLPSLNMMLENGFAHAIDETRCVSDSMVTWGAWC